MSSFPFYRSFNLSISNKKIRPIASVLIFNLIAYYIPKKLTKNEKYSTSLFALLYEILVNVFLDLKYNLYRYFGPGVDWLALVPIFGTYPALNIIFLNYIPFPSSAMRKMLYILGWSLFALIYEWSSTQAGWFYCIEWKLWYSAFCYPPIFFILAKNLEILKSLKRRFF